MLLKDTLSVANNLPELVRGCLVKSTLWAYIISEVQ